MLGLDLNSGYWQMETDPESHLLTKFVTSFGLFHFRVITFCLKGASATLQTLRNHVLQSCLGDTCMVYLYDIIIFSKDTQTHFGEIKQVFVSSRRALPSS